MQDTWQSRYEEKDVLVVKFEQILTEDIKQLFEEVASIQEDVSKEWLIDENSNIVQVKEFLTNLADRLSVCVSQMEEYRNYQKEFKVSSTKYDLESFINDIHIYFNIFYSCRSQYDFSLKSFPKIGRHL